MRIKKILCLSALLMLINFTVQPKDVADYFIDMPSYLMPTFESSYRVELLENHLESGRDSLENLFGTKVVLLELDTINQHIVLQSTSSSRFEMQIIEHQNDTLIGIINTVCGPVCSSYIQFFDIEWKEVKVDFPKHDITQWLKADNSPEENKIVKDLVKVSFVDLYFNPKEKVVEVKNNSSEYLSKEDRTVVSGLLTENNLKVSFSKLSRVVESKVKEKK